MNALETLYADRCKGGGNFADIHEHLPTLRSYAGHVRRIVEIGVRTGNSTTALLAGLMDAGGGTLLSYDIRCGGFVPPTTRNVFWHFTLQDTHAPDFTIPPCDLLFIDGCHKYESVAADLKHASNASRFIILHDTDPARDEQYGDGVCRAMDEFLAAHPEWKIRERFTNCNGLTVLARL